MDRRDFLKTTAATLLGSTAIALANKDNNSLAQEAVAEVPEYTAKSLPRNRSNAKT